MNYFKCADKFFFFNEGEAATAYEEAKKLNLPIGIMQPTRRPGVWDRVQIIGHRPRRQIVEDLKRCRTEDSKARLHVELDALEKCYTDAGRTFLPLMVAA